MPSALVRQWILLTLLPTRPRRVDTATLEERLRARGLRIHRRTIQRDLVELATVFPIVADERSKPYGWRWADGADLVSALFARDPSMAPPGTCTIRLRVPSEHATAVTLGLRSRRETRGEVKVTSLGATSEIHATVEDGDPLRRWLLGNADVVEVVAPPELRSEMADRARRALVNHEAGRPRRDSL